MNATTKNITTTIKPTAKKVAMITEALRLAGDFAEAYGMDAFRFDIPSDPAHGALLDANDWMAYGDGVEIAVEDLNDVDYRAITKKDWHAEIKAIVRAAARRAAKVTEFEITDLPKIGPITITSIGDENIYFTLANDSLGFVKLS